MTKPLPETVQPEVSEIQKLVYSFGFYAREYARLFYTNHADEDIALERMERAEQALRSAIAQLEKAAAAHPVTQGTPEA